MNSLNGGAAPVVNAPKSGPPVALIVIVILVIIGIVVGVVMATMPAPSPVIVTSPSLATGTSPSPATVPAGFSPASGSEMAGSAVAIMPDQMLAAKQDQAQKRAAVYVGKTQFQINNELAQEQHAQDKRAVIMRS